MYFLIGCNFKYQISTKHITFYEACIFFYLDKEYNIKAAEHISYDWVKEDLIHITPSVLQIFSHDNVAFCRDTCV
jgi:hypothetical protein